MWMCRCGEMNPDSSSFCQSCGDMKICSAAPSAETLRKQEEQRRLEIENARRERIQQEHNLKMNNLSKMGLDGYYEYKIVNLRDDDFGGIRSGAMEDTAAAAA